MIPESQEEARELGKQFVDDMNAVMSKYEITLERGYDEGEFWFKGAVNSYPSVGGMLVTHGGDPRIMVSLSDFRD